MPDRSIDRDYVAELAISLHSLGKPARPASVALPNNPDTLLQSGTSRGIEPRSEGNLPRLSGLSLVQPFGDSAICGAKGIPRLR